MGNFAEAMAKTVQQIQAAAQTRRDCINQLQHTTQEFLQECQVADQHRSDDLRHLASDLKRQMKNTEKARLDAAQQFVQETRQAIHDIGISVSELRSDTHNLVQRFAMEHRDIAQQLHRSLAAHTRARLDSARTVAGQHQSDTRSLRQHLRREAQHLLASLQNADRERHYASSRDLQAVADDLRQASQIWRHELKKKAPHDTAEVAAMTMPPIEERAEAPAEIPVPREELLHPPVFDVGTSPFAIEEAEPTRAGSEAERVMQVIADHPEGIRLVEIGNELGVDWRGLIAAVKFLMDNGRVEKIDNVYYPAQPGQEGE